MQSQNAVCAAWLMGDRTLLRLLSGPPLYQQPAPACDWQAATGRNLALQLKQQRRRQWRRRSGSPVGGGAAAQPQAAAAGSAVAQEKGRQPSRKLQH